MTDVLFTQQQVESLNCAITHAPESLISAIARDTRIVTLLNTYLSRASALDVGYLTEMLELGHFGVVKFPPTQPYPTDPRKLRLGRGKAGPILAPALQNPPVPPAPAVPDVPTVLAVPTVMQVSQTPIVSQTPPALHIPHVPHVPPTPAVPAVPQVSQALPHTNSKPSKSNGKPTIAPPDLQTSTDQQVLPISLTPETPIDLLSQPLPPAPIALSLEETLPVLHLPDLSSVKQILETPTVRPDPIVPIDPLLITPQTPQTPTVLPDLIALPLSQAPLTPSVAPDNPQPKSKGKGKVKGQVKGKGKALLTNSQPPKREPLAPDVTSAAEDSWDEQPRSLTPKVEELGNFIQSDYDKAKGTVLDCSPDSYTLCRQEISQQLEHIYHNTKVREHNLAVARFCRRFSL